jgi:hypothetical protein
MANSNKKLTKIINEKHFVSKKKGGGIIHIQAWENDKKEVVKYAMAYINTNIFSNDNGRVIGYDNAHNFHHKHYFGEIFEIDDFSTFENQLNIFEQEIQEFLI